MAGRGWRFFRKSHVNVRLVAVEKCLVKLYALDFSVFSRLEGRYGIEPASVLPKTMPGDGGPKDGKILGP